MNLKSYKVSGSWIFIEYMTLPLTIIYMVAVPLVTRWLVSNLYFYFYFFFFSTSSILHILKHAVETWKNIKRIILSIHGLSLNMWNGSWVRRLKRELWTNDLTSNRVRAGNIYYMIIIFKCKVRLWRKSTKLLYKLKQGIP